MSSMATTEFRHCVLFNESILLFRDLGMGLILVIVIAIQKVWYRGFIFGRTHLSKVKRDLM